jgi:hypothetical protein
MQVRRLLNTTSISIATTEPGGWLLVGRVNAVAIDLLASAFRL